MFDSNHWPLSNVSLTGHQHFKIQSLSGFDKKRHLIPSEPNNRTRTFVSGICEKELVDELDRVYPKLRAQFGLRRVDLQSSDPEDGVGAISTPWFDYQILIGIDPDDPSQSFFRREILNIRSLDPFRSGGLDSVFSDTFDAVEFTSVNELDVAELIDSLEQIDSEALTIDFDRTATWCHLTMDGVIGKMVFTADRVTLQANGFELPSNLIDSFQKLGNRLAGVEALFDG